MLRIWSKSVENAPRKNEKRRPAHDPVYLVKWDKNDTLNPRNWPVGYKCWVTFQLGMLALAGSLGTSITTPADDTIAEYVGVSNEVAVLDVSIYL
jgi:hypothetical protein